MDFIDLCQSRESCRSFNDKKIDREKLLKCIEMARIAPSACNGQPWHMYLIDETEKVQTVAKTIYNLGLNKFALQAPAFVVIEERETNAKAKMGAKAKKQEYTLIDIGLLASNIVYTAKDQGINSCIIGWFNEPELKKILDINEKNRIRLVIALGYSDNDKLREKTRKELKEILTIN